mmetsp:Transcript_14226/g.24874  ORF Transcript_14226/g.24874 Transcript_14226/m.24874 type:complete len:252 (+) Transcript_14226:142-897(+)
MLLTAGMAHALMLCAVLLSTLKLPVWAAQPVLSLERVVFQTLEGDIEFAFYPEVAPQTCAHIFRLVQLGLYDSNNFFRVDEGFVAQTGDVLSGRLLPLNQQQLMHAIKKLPLEVSEDVKHELGALSVEEDSSSISIVLDKAPHMDMKYTIFGRVTHGWLVIKKMERLRAAQEATMMPYERITILSTSWYTLGKPMPGMTLPRAAVKCAFIGCEMSAGTDKNPCLLELDLVRRRATIQAQEMEEARTQMLPG